MEAVVCDRVPYGGRVSDGPAVPPPALGDDADDAQTERHADIRDDDLAREQERIERRVEELRVRTGGEVHPGEVLQLRAEQDALADQLDALADAFDSEADRRDRSAEARDTRALARDRAAADRAVDRGVPDVGALDRHHAAVARDWAASDRHDSRLDRRRAAGARRSAAEARRSAATQSDAEPTQDHDASG